MPNSAPPDHTHTLTSFDYLSDEVYEIERRRVFHQGWMLAGRAERLQPGSRTVVELAGESVLLTRDLGGELHAFANVCRHRGARLCDRSDGTAQGSVMCPYHAWTYGLDGRLIATPHLDDEQVDKASLPLWAYQVRDWEGFLFVSIADDPPSFEAWMAEHCSDLLALQRFGFAHLRVAETTTFEVAANWKILLENYQECLHCTRVHPELVQAIPLYRSGWVRDHERDDGGVAITGSYTLPDTTDALPPLPGISDLDAHSYYGGTIFPNGFIDVSGTAAVLSTLYPSGPHHTTMVMEYLFAPDTIESPGFDPTPTVEFNDLIAAQDGAVCERVHEGVSSRAFDHGVLTVKDEYVISFTRHYLTTRGPIQG